MLKHPKLEAKADASSDSPKTANTIRRLAFHKKHVRAFARWYEENRPDFLLSTNFLGGALLPYAVKALGLNIPVYQYCPDVFDSPGSGVCNLLTKAYIASDFGKDVLISKGQSPDTVSVCPFPLRKQFLLAGSLTKEEARKRLELPDRFTILCSFGGEGIGSIALLYELAARKVPCQAVVIGGHSKSTEEHFRRFAEKYPDFPVFQRGFVDNVEEYLAACDIQVGKGGISESLVDSVKAALKARELVKGRVLENSMLSAREACDALCEKCAAEGVQVIGTKFVLYKRNEKEPKIVLVKDKKKT